MVDYINRIKKQAMIQQSVVHWKGTDAFLQTFDKNKNFSHTNALLRWYHGAEKSK